MGAFFGKIWELRSGLTPIWFLLALVSVGPTMNSLLTPTQTTLILIAGALPWFIMVRLKAPSKPHRVYGDLVYVAICAWTVAAYIYGWSHWRQLGTAAVIMTLLFGSLWWSSRRNRLKVRIDKAVRAWPTLAEKIGLGKSWMEDLKVKGVGNWTAVLRWFPGDYKLRAVLDMAEDIEGARNLPSGSLSIVPIKNAQGRNRTDRALLECVTADPHSKAIPWPGPRVTSITQTIELGLYTDSKPERFTWWTKGVGGFHCLIAGLTRSGKSSLLDVLIGSYALAEDVVPLLADFKGGESFLKWAPLSGWFTSDIEEAVEMLRALDRIVRRRGELKAARGWDSWKPSREDPVYIFFIDEVAELLGARATGETLTLIESIGRMGAGLGVLLCMATQYPTVGGAIGSSQLKTQLGWRACFRLQAADQLYYILPNAPSGIDPSQIPKDRRGTCYVDAEGEFKHKPLRVMYMKKEQADTLVRDRWWCTVPFDPQAASVAGEGFKRRLIWTPEMLDALRKGKTIADLTADDLSADVDEDPPTAPNTREEPELEPINGPGAHMPLDQMAAASPLTPEEEQARQALLESMREDGDEDEARRALTDLLVKAGPKGATPAEMRASLKKSERWVHRELERRRGDGRVIHVSHGRYIAPQFANPASAPTSA